MVSRAKKLLSWLILHGLEHIFVPFIEQWMQENCPEIETVTDGNQSPFFVV